MPASAIDILKREVKVLMFDQYGTVVDMQSGLTEAVTPFLQEKNWLGEPYRFITWWRRTHYEDSMIDALCDQRAYAVSRNRPPRCLPRDAAGGD